jgi:uncharacterized membrane protein (DUF485 family)
MIESDRHAVAARLDDLARRRSRFLWPLLAGGLGSYLCVVMLFAWWPSAAGLRVFGVVNLGYLLAVCQFLMVFVVCLVYCRWARRVFDPLAAEIRGLAERLDASAAPAGAEVVR